MFFVKITGTTFFFEYRRIQFKMIPLLYAFASTVRIEIPVYRHQSPCLPMSVTPAFDTSQNTFTLSYKKPV